MDHTSASHRTGIVSLSQIAPRCVSRIGITSLIAWFAFVGLACKTENPVELLQVSSAAIQEFESTPYLRLFGSGFPLERECRVTLDGQIRRPGDSRQRLQMGLAGKAVSAEQIEVRFSSVDLKELGETGIFEGRIKAAFPSRDGQAEVTGTLPRASLDFSQVTTLSWKEKRVRWDQARSLATRIGIDSIDEQDHEPGLVIKNIVSGSPAEGAGLKKGDVISGHGPAVVRSLYDLLPEPGSSEMQLRVARLGEAEPLIVRIPLNELSASQLDTTQMQLVFLLVFALLCLVFFSPAATAPWRRVSHFVASTLCENATKTGLADGENSLMTERDQAQPSRRKKTAVDLFFEPLIVGFVFVGTVFSRRLFARDVDPLVVCLAVFVSRISFILFISRRSSLKQRLHMAFRTSRYMVLACVPIAYAGLLVGSSSLQSMVAAQGGLPWEWSIFKTPALLLVFPLFMISCAVGLISSSDIGDDKNRFVRWTEIAYRAFMAAIGAVIFLGGWQRDHLPVLASIDFDAVSTVILVIKVYALRYLAHVIRFVRFEQLISNRVHLLLLLGAGALTALWRYLDVSAQIEATIGYTLFITIIIALSVAAVRLYMTPSKSETIFPHPDPFI
jgi:hypothetical protein